MTDKMRSDSCDHVIKVDRYVAASTHEIGENDHYKGLRIHSADGLHDFVDGKIRESFEPSCPVLDLGAGTGAMSLRLADMGFQVSSADIAPENFRLHDAVPFRKVDLNTAFQPASEIVLAG